MPASGIALLQGGIHPFHLAHHLNPTSPFHYPSNFSAASATDYNLLLWFHLKQP